MSKDVNNTNDLNEYINNVYNTQLGDNQTNGDNCEFAIKDYGDILFAENDRRSSYVRVPFTPVIDNPKATELSSYQNADSSECLDKIESTENLTTTTDYIEKGPRQKPLAERIAKLMRDGWKLPTPQLIISVTGGAHLFKLSTPRVRYAFQRGLINAAVTTDAWIITGGTYTGVMKEVGDAGDKRRYKNTKTPSKVQLIGIGSWNYTTDRHCLVQHRSLSSESSVNLTPLIPLTQQLSTRVSQNDDQTNGSDIGVLLHLPRNIPTKTTRHEIMQRERTTKIYRSRTPKLGENSWPLDLNHTHFILLDDMLGENMELASIEMIQNINVRADFSLKPRAEIEHAISEIYAIPIVQILANGGASSVLTVCKALQQGTPVIVIEGTGRAADEIAREYRYLYGDHSTRYEEQRSIDIYNKATSKFKDFEDRIRSPSGHQTVLNHTNLDQFIKHLTSRDGYFLISTFQFYNEHGEQKLDDAILHALFNAARILPSEGKQRTTELKLAMAWNKFGHIKQNILSIKKIIEWTDLELDQALRDALRMNKIRCADLLVEYGASFDRLQRLNLLDKLYQEMETNGLPYSSRMIEKIRQCEESLNWTTTGKKYFYEDYLDIDLNDKQNLTLTWADNSTTKYGILDDESIPINSTRNFKHPLCVFNAVDMIQVNGFLNTISIRFDNTIPSSINETPVCYLISPTNDPNSYLIAFKCQLQLSSNNLRDIRHYKTAKKPLFVTSGQYIAIGFTEKTGFPCNVSKRNQHSFDLNQIEAICPIAAKTSIKFNVESLNGSAITFNIDPSPAFFRDLFFWSLFFYRHNLSTYLCSKSPNTIVAALFASKIYHQAAEFSNKSEKRLDFIEKEKEFDKHASAILDMCFEENDEFAVNILTKNSPLFFNKNPLEIAESINSRSFLATKTVQHYLDRQWYGELNGYDNNTFWISSFIFIMCFIPILIPIHSLSKFIISDKRQPKAWEKKGHIIGWTARIFYRFKEFYVGRAIVRFYYNIVFYIFFLTLFSYVLLVDYFPLNVNGGQRSGYNNLLIPISEICVHILIWSLIFEEGHEFIQDRREKKKNHSRYNLWNYFTQEKWNILDIVAIIIYLIGFITRFILIKQAFIASKILMCIDLFLWFIRILHVFAAYERLGPKLLMIFNTMKDLLFFIYFILIFLAGYSITSYALLISKHQVLWENAQNESSSREYKALNNGTGLWNWEILKNIINWGMWKVYGQIDLETVYRFDDEIKVTMDNDAYGIIAFILTIFFVSVANILLLSVLVALFNVTIQKVHDSARESWAYHRFLLVKEYNKKTFLPPPLNIFIYLFSSLYHCLKDCRSKKFSNKYGIHSEDEITKLDSNLFDMVVFNGADRIRQAGSINSVTINFSSLPQIIHPTITLYLLSTDNENSNMFIVDDESPLLTRHIGRRGVQTILLGDSLQCYENQFVGLAFGPNSGCPASVKDQNEHSVNLIDFTNLRNRGKSIHFINYPNKGAAFSFTIERSLKKQINSMSASETPKRLLEAIPVIELNDFAKPDPINRQKCNKLEESSSLIVTTQNKFEERDNTLRESSIAEDYWKIIVEKIKQQEAKMVEEQNDTFHSSQIYKSTSIFQSSREK